VRANNLEQLEQIRLVNWFHFNFPEFADDLHHFANQRKCSPREGRQLKLMGVKRGVSDIFLGIPTKYYHGLWIELKVEKGKLTKEQIAFIERKNKRGYFAIAVWGFEAARRVILEYLKDYISDSSI
jgi:hypothetical protein